MPTPMTYRYFLDKAFSSAWLWFQVNLTATEEVVILADFHENGEWHIDSTSVHRGDIFHDIYPNVPFPKVWQTSIYTNIPFHKVWQTN